MSRTALLIRCTTNEADRIRIEAEKQRRTISAYVLQVVTRAVEVEDRLFASMNRYSALNQAMSRRATIALGPRTAILVRCEDTEADRIREAARRRDIAINAFVLQALTRAWNVQMTHPSGVTATNAPSPATPIA